VPKRASESPELADLTEHQLNLMAERMAALRVSFDDETEGSLAMVA
jgi:hypothetical protein